MKPKPNRARVGGLVGTLAAGLMMYTAYPMMSGGVALDGADALGARIIGGWPAGMGVLVLIGVLLLPEVYVRAASNAFMGPGWMRGLQWGLVIWAVNQVAIAPWLGGGFLGLADGTLPAFGSMLAALAYGVVFGGIAHGGRVRSFEEADTEEIIIIERTG